MFNKKAGRKHYESIYPNCVMVYSQDLAVGDSLRSGGIVAEVRVLHNLNEVMYAVKGVNNNITVSLDVMFHIKK